MMFLLVASLLSANPAVQSAIPAPVAEATAPKPKKEKKICKTADDTTGSRMVKRTCFTQEQWDSQSQGRSADQIGTIPTNH
jgi:hypothetical protein